jgi:hypothetical protein
MTAVAVRQASHPDPAGGPGCHTAILVRCSAGLDIVSAGPADVPWSEALLAVAGIPCPVRFYSTWLPDGSKTRQRQYASQGSRQGCRQLPAGPQRRRRRPARNGHRSRCGQAQPPGVTEMTAVKASALDFGGYAATSAMSQLPLRVPDRAGWPPAGRAGQLHGRHPESSGVLYQDVVGLARHGYPAGLGPGRHNADAEASYLRAVEHAACRHLAGVPWPGTRAAVPARGLVSPGRRSRVPGDAPCHRGARAEAPDLRAGSYCGARGAAAPAQWRRSREMVSLAGGPGRRR